MTVPSDHLELRRYQQEGISFLTRQGRAILGDEQGVGKTVQALIAARNLVPYGTGRILVIAPKSAAGVWIIEADKWLAEEARSYQGTARSYEVLDNSPIVITNYSLMGEVFKRHPHWAVIIFDEAHKLKGWRPLGKRSTYKDLKRGSSKYKFFLTGTPIFSHAGDLWPMLHQIRPDVFTSYWGFVDQWCVVDNNGFGNVIIGNKNPRSLHNGLKKHGFMLRRLKKDVMPELPPKTRMEWPLEMTPQQARDYNRLAKDLMVELEDSTLIVPNKVALVVRLRQLLVCPRVLGFAYRGGAEEALLEELSEGNTPSVIFTPFTEPLPYFTELMEKAKRPTRTIQGGMTPEKLAETIKWFQNYEGDREPVLLSSLLMGTSWTATRATQAYFIGYDWSPSNNFQAEDRLHRHGQRYATTIKYAMHHGTIDEHVMDILNGKVSIQKAILDPESFLFGRSSKVVGSTK